MKKKTKKKLLCDTEMVLYQHDDISHCYVGYGFTELPFAVLLHSHLWSHWQISANTMFGLHSSAKNLEITLVYLDGIWQPPHTHSSWYKSGEMGLCRCDSGLLWQSETFHYQIITSAAECRKWQHITRQILCLDILQCALQALFNNIRFNSYGRAGKQRIANRQFLRVDAE